MGLYQIATVANKYEDLPIQQYSQTLKSGDLILFRHQKYNFLLVGLDRIMSHVGLVWKVDDEVYMIDMNPTLQGPYAKKLTAYYEGSSIRIVKLVDVLQSYPGIVLVRTLKQPLQDELLFSKKILEWGLHIDYNEAVSKKGVLTWLSIAFSTIVPEFALFLNSWTVLAWPRTSSFCSELIGEIMKHCKRLQQDTFSIYGPIGFQHGLHASFDTVWNPEIRLVAAIL